MLLNLGIDSVFGMFDFYLIYWRDLFPRLAKLRKELYVGLVIIFSFICSLMFCTASGYHVFNLFNTHACGISLVLALIAELIFFPWIFGINKLEILMYRTTGEKIPFFVKLIVKFFITPFILIIFVIMWINEFRPSTQTSRGWPVAIAWAGRLLWIVPILCVGLGAIPALRVECENVYDLIEQQHGIRFNCKTWDDDTYEEVNQKEGGEKETKAIKKEEKPG